MKPHPHRDRKGAAALEFAVVAPAMLTMFFGTLSMGLALWTLCALQDAAQRGARCSAISSTLCAAVTAGCDSASPVVCYVEGVAILKGVGGVTANEVVVSSTTIAGVSFVTVTINHAYSMAGYSLTISASSSYPQNLSSWIATPAAT